MESAIPAFLQPMIKASIARLEKLRASIAKIEADRTKALAGLPSEFGFGNVNDFVDAVKLAVGKGSVQKRKRATITPKKRAEVLRRLEAKESAISIAKALKISVPSVYAIKGSAARPEVATKTKPAKDKTKT